MNKKSLLLILLLPFLVAATTFTVHVMVISPTIPYTQPGEIDLPYGSAQINTRYISTRWDGLNCYTYTDTNQGARIAFFYPTGAIASYALDLAYTETAWVTNTLYLTGSLSTNTVAALFDVTTNWPPTFTTNSVTVFQTLPGYFHPGQTLEPLGSQIFALHNGAVVAAWHLNVQTGQKALVAFHPVGGSWVTNVQDLAGFFLSQQTAGSIFVTQHPHSKVVYVGGIQDGWANFCSAVFSVTPSTLTFLSNILWATDYPNNGVYQDIAPDEEFAVNVNVFPHGTNLMAIYNTENNYLSWHNPFKRITLLVSFDILPSGDYITNAVSYSSNYTERNYPSWAFTKEKLYMVPTTTNQFPVPSATESDLTVDRGLPISRLGNWSQIAQGTNCIGYVKRDGRAVILRGL